MLKIYDATQPDKLYPLVLEPDAYCVTHAYDGQDTLTFDISPTNREYFRIGEEVRITDGTNRYVVKDIDECAAVSTIECTLDLDDWKEGFYAEFREENAYLSELLEKIKPAGWSVSGAGVASARKTLEASEDKPIEQVTPYDLLAKIAELWQVTFQYEVLNKRLLVIDPSLFQPSGEYLMEELNLKSLKYNGSSKSFATRLYARGKRNEDGTYLTIAAANGGKEYVENRAYSNRVISIGWKDERYTTAQSLKKAAEDKLKSMAYPVRSYRCEVSDLAKRHPEYSFLSFALYRIVTLVDKRRKTRVNHQIVEYKEYPEAPEKNVVTLSSTVPQIKSSINHVVSGVEQSLEDTRSDMQQAIAHATALITGAQGGNVVTRMVNGKPVEIMIMDTDNMDTAKRIWRWNIAGFGYSNHGVNGPFQTAITMDGKIVADFIQAGTMSANYIKAGRLKSTNGRLVFDLDGAALRVYNYEGEQIMQLDVTGQKFYESGDFIGKVGSNKLKDHPEKKGLVFDLDMRGDYMCWAARKSASDDTYTICLSFEREKINDVLSKGLSVQSEVNMNYNRVNRCSSLINSTSNVPYALSYISKGNYLELLVNYQKGTQFAKGITLFESDGRLKEHIKPSQKPALAELMQWKHRRFDWKRDGSHVDCGYIAQEMEQINPAYVLKIPQQDGRELYQMDERYLIPVMSKAIQELAQEVAHQRRQIEALQACSGVQPEPIPAEVEIQEQVAQYTETFDFTPIPEEPAAPAILRKEEMIDEEIN